MSKTRMVVVRHGETEWNVEGRLQGHADSPLTENGLAQARALAERLRSEAFDAVYSSDLGRARHTAEIIADGSGWRIILESLEERVNVLDGREIHVSQTPFVS